MSAILYLKKMYELYEFFFQYSEHIHYHDYVETRVSNLKFIKDNDIGLAMT